VVGPLITIFWPNVEHVCLEELEVFGVAEAQLDVSCHVVPGALLDEMLEETLQPGRRVEALDNIFPPDTQDFAIDLFAQREDDSVRSFGKII
jgi:hypothetical protein